VEEADRKHGILNPSTTVVEWKKAGLCKNLKGQLNACWKTLTRQLGAQGKILTVTIVA